MGDIESSLSLKTSPRHVPTLDSDHRLLPPATPVTPLPCLPTSRLTVVLITDCPHLPDLDLNTPTSPSLPRFPPPTSTHKHTRLPRQKSLHPYNLHQISRGTLRFCGKNDMWDSKPPNLFGVVGHSRRRCVTGTRCPSTITLFVPHVRVPFSPLP